MFLDPHKKIFAAKQAEGGHVPVGGWMFDTTDASLAQWLRPMLEPFKCELHPKPHNGYEPWDPVAGRGREATMFRFPLRSTKELADQSLIVAKAQGAARVMDPETLEHDVVQPFMDGAIERLLFMRVDPRHRTPSSLQLQTL